MRQTELISSSDFLGPSLALLVVLVIFMICCSGLLIVSDTCCVLEGDDCLHKITFESAPENSFAYKLKQVMKGKNHA